MAKEDAGLKLILWVLTAASLGVFYLIKWIWSLFQPGEPTPPTPDHSTPQFSAAEKKALGQQAFHHEMKMALHQKAVEARAAGKPHFGVLRQAQTHAILQSKEEAKLDGEIVGIRVCPAGPRRLHDDYCDMVAEHIYGFDEALKAMPIPCRKDWCNCYWEIVFKDDIT